MIVLYIFLGIILFIFIMLHFPLVLNAEVSNEKKDVKVKYLFFTIYPLKEKKKNKKPKKRKNKKSKLSKRKRKMLEKELEEEKQEYEKALREADLHSNREDSYKDFLPKTERTSEQMAEETPDEEVKNVKQEKATNENTKKSVKKKKKKKKKKAKRDKSLSDKIDDLKEKWEQIKPYIPLTKKTVKKLLKSIWITSLELNLAVAKEDAYECAMAFGRINTAVFNALGVVKTFFSVGVKKINITSKFNSNETEYYFKCKVKTRPSTIIAIAFCTLISFIKIYFKNRKKEKNHN